MSYIKILTSSFYIHKTVNDFISFWKLSFNGEEEKRLGVSSRSHACEDMKFQSHSAHSCQPPLHSPATVPLGCSTKTQHSIKQRNWIREHTMCRKLSWPFQEKNWKPQLRNRTDIFPSRRWSFTYHIAISKLPEVRVPKPRKMPAPERFGNYFPSLSSFRLAVSSVIWMQL